MDLGSAVGAGNIKAVEAGLKAGQLPYTENSRGTTPLDIAAEINNKEVATLLVKKTNELGEEVALKAFLRALSRKQPLIVGLFVYYGVSLIYRDDEGEFPGDYPIHAAVRTGDVEVVRAMVENGASVHMLHGLSQVTPHQLAQALGHKKMEKYLTKAFVRQMTYHKQGNKKLIAYVACGVAAVAVTAAVGFLVKDYRVVKKEQGSARKQ